MSRWFERHVSEGWEVERQDRLARGEAGPSNQHHFCHTLLPERVFDAAGLQFVESLMGKRGHELLAEVWNRGCTKKAKARHFKRVWTPLTDRWKAIVVTPPPPLGPGEAHLIGIWRDYANSMVASEKEGSSTGDASGAVRYFCLERGHVQGTTFVGEWLGFGNRRDLGRGSEPSPEAMIQFMADLHGINADFSDRPGAEVVLKVDGQTIEPGADLKELDLQGANPSAANLEGVNLEGANLEGANLYKANLKGANLSGASLPNVDFRGANLTGADLSQANLTGADLREADLKGANLQRATANERTDWPKDFNPVAAGVAFESLSASANDVDVELQQADGRPASSAPEPLPAEPGFSMAEKLGKLADLRDRGMLTEEEFQEQKMKLLE